MIRQVAASVAVASVLVFVAVSTTPLNGQGGGAATPPRTPWGHPDLQGTWDNHSITPLERPARFAGREFLTREEAIELEKAAARQNAEIDSRENAGTVQDVSLAYNDSRTTRISVDRPAACI